MNFLTTIYVFFDSFFSKYNYNSLWWYINDNFLPTNVVSAFSGASDYFFLFFEKFCSLLLFTVNLPFFFFNFSEIFLFFGFNSTMINAVSIAVKFLLCIAILIFARGGIPRFRFDYLTKLGWIRFLSLVLLSFLIEILLLSMV